MRRVSDRFTSELVIENKAIMRLLRNPKAEREQYNIIKTDFDDFIIDLDEQRQRAQEQVHPAINPSNELGKMTTLLATATNYINALDNYIKDDRTVEQNRVLAVAHREDNIKHVFQLFKHGCLELRHARTPESYETHSEALQGSLNNFMSKFGKELSNEQKKAVEEGYRAITEPTQSNSMRLRR